MKRVLVANRGEIAVRVIRACHALGLEAYLAISTADRDSLGAKMADRAICVGPAAARDSYLNMDALVAAAVGSGCDAIHPGYGFLSERAAFAKLVTQTGIKFIGPRSEVIDLMGDKVRARAAAEAAGLAIPPGTPRIEELGIAEAFADRHGLPLLIKASAGGGGRGMRLVRERGELAGAFLSASAEAGAAFGDSAVFVERYIERARHVEVQVLADEHGNVLHLGERECSIQRRYQKLIEEAPSSAIKPETRAQLTAAAVRIATHVGYTNAGTVEFILDSDTDEFFFLEMNTRVQVEHPVTELTTGIDIVAQQLEIAAGKPLLINQSDVRLHGHAIECRINAEDPSHAFRPSPGRLKTWIAPAGDGVRTDSHCYSGYTIPPYYDSLLGKIIVHAETRPAAVEKMLKALCDLQIEGITTTKAFHEAVLGDTEYRSNQIRTRWVEEDFLRRWSN